MFGALPPPILLEKSALTMDAELAGRRALVTGGARGIGGAIAAALAGVGAWVAIGARSADQVQQMADQIAETGAETLALELDVSKADSV
ncbi:MAG: SDR family NAD(P)-dependent oxidoreductase, partial [Candidatus Latescibacteria bacterium]|nr:SDR family NAD(P)-dependent oxidoreductase [Candidatus Latescibacterota bacterium]